MKLATTTADFNGYVDTYEEKVKLICDAGFKYIDIDFSNIDVFMGSRWEDKAKKLNEYAKSLGAKFVQAHSPCSANPVVYDEKREPFIEETKRSFEVCKILGIENMVVHNGSVIGMDKKTFFEENEKFSHELFPIMEKTGVNMCIENSTVINMAERYFFFDGCDMREFIEKLNHPLLKACWDTGHANIENHHYKDIMDLGNHLTTIHVHDNNGRNDEHMMPYTGTMNFDELMCGLIDSGYKGYFTLEATLSLMNIKTHMRSRRVFEKDTRLYRTPLALKFEAEKFLYKAGEYILKAYDVFDK